MFEPSKTMFLSEILPVKLESQNYQSFQINPGIDKSFGNQISWRLSNRKDGRVVIFNQETCTFWALGQGGVELPTQEDWQNYLEIALEQLKDKIGDSVYQVEKLETSPKMTTKIEAELAVQVLKFSEPIRPKILMSENNVNVETDVEYWSEVFELEGNATPAITINLKTRIIYKENLSYFVAKHFQKNDLTKEFLQDLLVKPIDSSSTATVIREAGIVFDRRNELIAKASSPIIQEKLKEASDNEKIISIQFDSKGGFYDYALNTLRPILTTTNSYLFKVEYGDLLKKTKLKYTERSQFFREFLEDIIENLVYYCFKANEYLSSEKYPDLFIPLPYKLENTELLFGNSITAIKKRSLSGLKQGGVFRLHDRFKEIKQIRLGILKPYNITTGDFREKLARQLKSYQFDLCLSNKCCINFDFNELTGAEMRASLEKSISQINGMPIDLVLVILPKSQEEEEENGHNLYELIKKHLLRYEIASQVIYENTILKDETFPHLLNNIVPGILGKLGNLPFVLAEPLTIADAFVGLDISRFRHDNRPGSRNVCASVRLYGQRGEFFKYRLDDSLVGGEEIPRQVLEDFFPYDDFSHKRTLIYRDGRFRGDEVKHLLARAKAIDAKFILVESVKSKIPRLYNFQNKELKKEGFPHPICYQELSKVDRGLALKISNSEVILVTTDVPEKLGVPRPIRLRIHEDGEQASLDELIQATLKLTLLHYGSLKDPRLPIPLYASDAIAYRRLQGIYPTVMEGDCQFWL